MRQWHAGIQAGRRLDSQGSALSQQRGDGVLLRLGHAAAQVPWPTVFVMSGARAFALLASAAWPLRRISRGEQLRQRRTRRRWHGHRVLWHSPGLRSGLSPRCSTIQRFRFTSESIFAVMFHENPISRLRQALSGKGQRVTILELTSWSLCDFSGLIVTVTAIRI